MRYILLLSIFIISIFAKETICVSILPQKFFVKKIVKDKFNIEVMVPPGSSPATYSVKPKQLKIIKNTKIYFSIGVPFEKAWIKRFKSVNKDLKVIDSAKYIHKISISEHHHELEIEHHHETLDPHIWLAPPLVMLQARVILEEVIRLDPKNIDFYLNQNLQIHYRLVKLNNSDMDELALAQKF